MDSYPAPSAHAVTGHPDGRRPRFRRELGRLDTVCLLIAAIVVLDTLGAVARGGMQTLTLLVLVAALFFVPAGLVIAELGSAFSQQGGPYVWARLAFGRLVGCLVAVIYWVETPVWVGGSLAITAVAAADRLIVPIQGPWRVLFALGFVWAVVALAALPMRVAKHIPRAGAIVQIMLLGFFTATVLLFAARKGVHGLAPADLTPTWTIFMVVAPVLVYSFLGLELPSATAGELRHPQRDIPAAIARAGALTCALYCVPVLAIVLVVPPGDRTGLTGFIDALAGVFTVYGSWSRAAGAVAAAAFLWSLVANGLTWIMASSRTQAAASLHGTGPGMLARMSARTGTPVAAIITGGAIATVTALAGFAVAGGDNARYFSAVLTLSVALLALGNLIVFPTLLRLRRSHPHVPRPFQVPGGAAGAWAASRLATVWSALALAAALWPGLATPTPDAHLPEGFDGDRLGFLLAEFVPLTAVIVTTMVFARRRGRGQPAPAGAARMRAAAWAASVPAGERREGPG